MKLFQNDLLSIHLKRKYSLLHCVWHYHATSPDLKLLEDSFLTCGQLVLEHQCAFLLMNMVHFSANKNQEFCDWTEQFVLPKMLAGGQKKIALIVKKAVFEQLKSKHLVNDTPIGLHEKKYFTDANLAKRWLTEA